MSYKYADESIKFGDNPNIPSSAYNNVTKSVVDLRGSANITDKLLNGAGIYSKKDIENARFNRFSRFGKILDPYGKVNPGREYLFFVKPDLHICIPNAGGNDILYKISGLNDSDKFSANNMTLNPQLCGHPYFKDLLQYHPNVIKELQRSVSFSPFVNLLSFSVNSPLQMYSVTAETMDNASTIYGTTYKYLKDSENSDEAFEFSLEFLDNKNLDTYHFFKAYTEYHNMRKSGLVTPPSMNYYRYKRLHNTMGIYKFIVAEDSETILYWAYIWGVYPTTCPREAFQDSSFSDGLNFSINFDSAFVEDMNPAILNQFNRLMKTLIDINGININNWAKVVNDDGSNNGYLPIAALVDGKMYDGDKNHKYRLRWY